MAELALEHGRDESELSDVPAGDAVFGRWTHSWCLRRRSGLLVFCSSVPSCSVSVPVWSPPCSRWSVREGACGGFRWALEYCIYEGLFAEQAACTVHWIPVCHFPPLYVFCAVLNLVHSGDRNCCCCILIFSFIAPILFIFLLGEPSLWSGDV